MVRALSDEDLASVIVYILSIPEDPVRHGAYLARIADCMGCHTSWYTKVNPGNFGGGNFVEIGPLKAFSVNITMDPSGISYYDENLFAVDLTQYSNV